LFAVPLTQISVDMWEQSGGKATKTITENGKKSRKIKISQKANARDLSKNQANQKPMGNTKLHRKLSKYNSNVGTQR